MTSTPLHRNIDKNAPLLHDEAAKMHPPIRVWILISNRWNSAITEYALSMAMSLREVGVSCVFTPQKNSKAEARGHIHGLDVRPVESFSLTTLLAFRKLQSTINPSVIFLFGGKETFLSRFINCEMKVRFFGEDGFQQKYSRLSFILSFSHINTFLAPNRSVYDRVKALSHKPSFLVPLGMSPGQLEDAPWSNLSSPLVILLVGRFDPVKGHREFFRIFRRALSLWDKRLPPLKLELIGYEANLKQTDLERAAVEEGIPSSNFSISTTWTGDLRKRQQEACVGVISSLGSEQICRVACEFLLSGTPIFVSGVGATEEMLIPYGGKSYKGLDDEQGAQRLVSLIEDRLKEDASMISERVQNARDYFSLMTMGRSLFAMLVEK